MPYFKKYWKRVGRKKTGKEVPCKICGKFVYKKGFQIKKFKTHYCSMNCKGVDNARRINEKYKNKSRIWLIGKNNNSWKGDKAGYFAVHDWIKRNYGKARECINCKTKTAKRYEWANISKKYLRDINDWKQLCKSCHAKYDETVKNRKRNLKGMFIK